ncbi:MAG TPA: molecular chaperone HtpG [Candidatus Marinimicrobia bacterium]|jgi:molecular chaperone HtpG|nr:molecular chaperone HtpG [Candidatus Neomarinimicrobiota bacterium]
MPKKKTDENQTYEFKAELKQLLNLIIHSLYTQPEIFLRELISNASDALNKVRFMQLTNQNILDPERELKIIIEVDPKKRTFAIEDTGIGMTREELIENIGTVAKSGTLQYLEQIQKEGKQIDADIIGQFGVGFYSVFMVTDEVTIETRHASPDSKAYLWKSDGKGTFSISEIIRPERGTRISFTLKEEYKDFAEEYYVKSIIQKYSNFINFPIYVGKERVNSIEALWRKPKDEIKEDELVEFYKFLTNDINPPLGHLHLSLEGSVNFKALLFIPSSAPYDIFYEIREKSLHLYANRVFVQDNATELLPEYLRFIKGVVDTEDLPLNISRQVTQDSPVMAKIRNVLTTRILAMLEDWAKNDVGKYEIFYKNFGHIFKLGVTTDIANKDKIVKLLRFETTAKNKGELTSLDEYIARMPKDQKEIYYLTGENREIAERNPKLEYFRKHNLEVLLLVDPIDIFIIPTIYEYEKKKFQSIEKADLKLEKKDKPAEGEALEENLLKSLITVFKETLGDKVEDVTVSSRLVDSPATLVVGKEGLEPQIEKFMKMMNQEVKPQKKILEINPAHPLIKNLSRLNLGNSHDPLLRQSILQIYESALLLDGNLENPTEFVARMVDILTTATK